MMYSRRSFTKERSGGAVRYEVAHRANLEVILFLYLKKVYAAELVV